MKTPITLEFESRLDGSRRDVWRWITSARGIAAEMRPFLRMTVPRGMRSLADVEFHPGVPLFRSRVFVFGVVPIGFWDLTLLELRAEDGFVEQSASASMKTWRHERQLASAANDTGVVLRDRLTFEPRWAPQVTAWFIERVFRHRHAVLRRNFAHGASAARAATRVDAVR